MDKEAEKESGPLRHPCKGRRKESQRTSCPLISNHYFIV